MVSYFAYLSPEIREIILSYLDYTSLDNYNEVHGGNNSEELKSVGYDILNLFKLRYPYLLDILKLKRRIGIDGYGYEYDKNADIFLNYLKIGSCDLDLEKYFTTGRGDYKNLYDKLEKFIKSRDWDYLREELMIIWVDVTKKIYPRLVVELNKWNIKDYELSERDFIIMFNKLEYMTFDEFIKNISVFNINNYTELDDWLPGYISYNSEIYERTFDYLKSDDFEKLYALYLAMILRYYYNLGIDINEENENWLLGYVRRHLPEALYKLSN
jgi:hypothetical protein